jgi:4-carboxymuconolactone decarboxylase
MTTTPARDRSESHVPDPLGPEVDRARYDRGAAVLARIDGAGGQRVVDSLADVAPALAHHIVAFGFGDVYARPGLTPSQRQLVTLGSLTALGGCEPQLEVHVNAALNVGLNPAEIVEALTHTAVYCGFPKALNATFVAKRVFAERNLLPVQNAQASVGVRDDPGERAEG